MCEGRGEGGVDRVERSAASAGAVMGWFGRGDEWFTQLHSAFGPDLLAMAKAWRRAVCR